MDLSQEELRQQREAFRRFEQERKDEEAARRLEQRYAAERADATLTPEEIAGILDGDPAVFNGNVRSPRRSMARRNSPRRSMGNRSSFGTMSTNRGTGATRVSVTTANQQAGSSVQHQIRRRLIGNPESAEGEPSARRPRVDFQIVTNGHRRQITVSIRGTDPNEEIPHVSSDEDENEDEEEDEDEDDDIVDEGERGEDDDEEEEEDEDEEEEEEEEDDDVIVINDERNPVDMGLFGMRERAHFYRGEMEIADLNDLFEMNPSSRAGLRALERPPLSPPRTTRRDPQFGDCTLCLDAPCDPTGCNQCKQLIGCKDCISTWYVTAYRNLSIPTCPLCRCVWSNRPDVKSMRFIAAEKRRAHLRRPTASRSNSGN